MDAEFVMMLLLIMRNELRCEDRDTLARVKKIFLRPDIKNIIAKTEVDIKDKANMILYFVAKHPNAVTVSFAKALITAFDKRTN